MCGECDDQTRASAKGTPRTALRTFTLADDPDATAPDAFGAKYPTNARTASRHPFREGIYLFPESPSCGDKNTQRQRSEGSGDGQGSGGNEGETPNPKDETLKSEFRRGPNAAQRENPQQNNAGAFFGNAQNGAPMHARGPFMTGPVPVSQFPHAVYSHHGGPAPQEWQDLLRQGSIGDGQLPLGARFFPGAPPGAPSPGMNRLNSASSNGSDPIGMYMNFDQVGGQIGSVLGGSGGSGGDLQAADGSNGSPARELHQEVTSEHWQSQFGPGVFVPNQAYGMSYGARNSGHFLPQPPIGGFNTGSFAPVQGGYPPEMQGQVGAPPTGYQHPGYPTEAMPAHFYGGGPPVMPDQIHRVGAAPPRSGSGSGLNRSPYQHGGGGTCTMLHSGGGDPNRQLPEGSIQRQPANAHPSIYQYTKSPNSVPTSSWSTEVTAAANYPHYMHGENAYARFYEQQGDASKGQGSSHLSGPSSVGPQVQGAVMAPGLVTHGGGLARVERNSQGSIHGTSGGSGGNGMSGGGGSVVAVSSMVPNGAHGVFHVSHSHEFLRHGGSDGEDGTRSFERNRSPGDPDDDIRSAAGAMAPGTKAREEMLLRYHKKRKERHFKKKIRYASRKVRADNRVRIKGRFARADAPLVAIDKSSAKNHKDLKKEEEGDAADTNGDADASDSDDSDNEVGDSMGKRTRRGRSGLVSVKDKTNKKQKIENASPGEKTQAAMTGFSELATPDVPPGACA